jgi:hypothetical protein
MATANDLLYATSASEATYARLSAMARSAITAGWPVIVDAAFLDREQRQSFARLAQELNVPFLIVDIRASEAIMHKRLAQRAIEDKDPSDASAAVLAHQLATHDPLSAEEMAHVLPIDSVDDAVGAAVRAAVAKVGL